MGLIFTLIYFFLAYLVARFYQERGQSPFLGFLLSILFSPFLALIIVLLLGVNYSRMQSTMPEQESVNIEHLKVVKPEPPPETPEQRDRRIKRERIIFIVCVIGLLFLVWGVIHFINVQVENVRQSDLQYRANH